MKLPVKKFTRFMHDEHRRLCAEINTALEELGEKFGVTFKASGGQVGEFEGMIKIQVKINDVGSGISSDEASWKRYAPAFGLPVDGFGKIVIVNGNAYEICGFTPNRPKYAVSIRRYDGKIFGTTVLSVKSQLNTSAAA